MFPEGSGNGLAGSIVFMLCKAEHHGGRAFCSRADLIMVARKEKETDRCRDRKTHTERKTGRETETETERDRDTQRDIEKG